MPLVTPRGISAGFNRATAAIVVGGQSLSLILTLLATPVLYSLLDDIVEWVRRRRAGRSTVDRSAEELSLGYQGEVPSAFFASTSSG